MKRTNLGLSLAGALFAAALIAGCGGGGGGTSNPAPAGVTATAPPVPAATINPSTAGTVNFTGPGTKVTISIQIPNTGKAAVISQPVWAKAFGPRLKDPNIRTMMNTSPTAKMRLAGASQNQWAQAYQNKTGRSPTYVGSSTQWMELVITQGATILVDEVFPCSVSASTCTGTFDAPIGTGYTATLLTYDPCTFLLSAGTTNNVTIVSGAANTIPITMNAVVAHYAVTQTTGSANSTFYQGLAFPDTVTFTLVPVDADGHTISGPGVLTDTTFTQISSVTVAPQASPAGITPAAGATLPIGPAPTFAIAPTTFNWDGSGSPGSISWLVTNTVTGSPLIPAVVAAPNSICAGYYYSCPGQNNIFFNSSSTTASIGVTGPGMAWTDVSGYGNGNGGAAFYGGATWNLEIGQAPPSPGPGVNYTVGVSENLPYGLAPFTGPTNTISFTDLGSCLNNILGSIPGSVPETFPVTNVTLNVTGQATGGSCQLQASDSAGNTPTTLTITINNPTLTIQKKNRK
jgi:hypothetical protein